MALSKGTKGEPPLVPFFLTVISSLRLNIKNLMVYIGLSNHMKSSLSHVLKMELQQNGGGGIQRGHSLPLVTV